jgi:hypothetical protein
MTTSTVSLSPRQRAATEHARALAAIPSGDDEALAVFTGHDDLATVYPAAYAEARHTITQLLQVIGELTC